VTASRRRPKASRPAVKRLDHTLRLLVAGDRRAAEALWLEVWWLARKQGIDADRSEVRRATAGKVKEGD